MSSVIKTTDRYAVTEWDPPALEQDQRVYIPARVIGQSLHLPDHVLVEVEYLDGLKCPVAVLVPRSSISIEASL